MTNYNERLDDELRMDAYYYSFSPTGNINIDRILSAVATAGKHYHHTQEWQEGGEQEAIQKAANDAAQALTSLTKELVEEAKPEIKAHPLGPVTLADCQRGLDHYEARLLKALEEV